MIKTNIYPAFSVPFAESFHPFAEQVNPLLRELLLRREAEGDRWRNPNPSLKQHPGVFESEFNLFSWPEPCIKDLNAFCYAALGEVIAKLNCYTPEQLSRLQISSQTWFHVTRKGGFTNTHNHPMASWSGVYCVDPGDTPADRPESGVLRFHNPHYWSATFLDPGNSRFSAPYHHGFWNLLHKPGQLTLFPSWVMHEVMPYYGERERIIVAFNSWFTQPD